MKPFKIASITAICAGVIFSTYTLRSAPPPRDGEAAWQVDRYRQDGPGRRPRPGGTHEQVSPIDDDRFGGPPRGGGFGGGEDEEEDRVPRRLMQNVMQLRGEVARLKRQEDEAVRMVERLENKDVAAKMTPEQLERKKKIANARKELAVLEQQDLVERVKSETDKAQKMINERLSDPDLPSGREEILNRMNERVKKIKDSATDFKALSSAIDELGPPPQEPGFGPQGGDEKLERIHREMEALRKRMDGLRYDLQDMGVGPGGAGFGPPRGGRPDGDDGGPPPPPDRREGRRGRPSADGDDFGGPPPPPPPPPPRDGDEPPPRN